MDINAICTHLINQGFTKKIRQNNTLPNFSAHFVKGVLDNPVYCGKIAFGRRKTEKIPGKRNEYHIVKQDEYEIYDGIHEAIVSEEDWNQAKQKRIVTGFKQPKSHDLEHEHLLSAIIKCPVCGAGMYGNVNRKKKADGEKIDASISTSAFENEIDNLHKQLKQTNGAKNKLAQQMDILDITDPQYDRKYSDMQYRLNAFYDKIVDIESRISEVEFRIETIKSDKIKSDSIYKYLLQFDKFYDEMTDKEKKMFMNSFLKSVEIYENERCDGRILKSLGFRFPIFSKDGEIVGVSWDKESSVEAIVLLSRSNEK